MKKNIPQLCFLFLFLIYSLVHGADENSTSEITNVKVGVILDTSSWDSGISWSCMQLALEDFYASHQNYTMQTVMLLVLQLLC